MNYKKWLCGISALTVCCMLTGCHMSHEWQEATCMTPKTCTVGGETEGEALGHTWVDATCTEPKHCSVCGETEGDVIAHTWVEATCSEPKHCSVCGETEGEALEHTLTEANYQQPATCTVCGETVGEPLMAYFEEEGWLCDEELDIDYPFTVFCREDNQGLTTTGKVTFSDYETFASDEAHEGLEGYEWQTVTITLLFDDENANNYGFNAYLGIDDYYAETRESVEWNVNYTINYNGKNYDECQMSYEILQNGWIEDTYIIKYRSTWRVPEGYDGNVAYVTDMSNGCKVLENQMRSVMGSLKSGTMFFSGILF